MKPSKSIFIYKDRGYSKTVLCVPGWAMDGAIFSFLNLPFNYIIMDQVNPDSFLDDFRDYIRAMSLFPIPILGFSLGGKLGIEYAKHFSEYVCSLILVGIRNVYPRPFLDTVGDQLQKNKSGFLIQFYKNCFFDSTHYTLFKNSLLKHYLTRFSLKYLMDTLSFLETPLKETLNELQVPITIFHGKEDKVAPCEEIHHLIPKKSNVNSIILDKCGHFPFFDKRIKNLMMRQI